jgi:hypothetical protein
MVIGLNLVSWRCPTSREDASTASPPLLFRPHTPSSCHLVRAQSKSFSNSTGYGRSFKINFNNPQCIVWAVLALARLDEKIPSNEAALLLFEHGTPLVYGVRRTLIAVIKTFCDERMEDTWSTAEFDHPL